MTDFTYLIFLQKKGNAMDSAMAKSSAHHTLLLRTDVTLYMFMYVNMICSYLFYVEVVFLYFTVEL